MSEELNALETPALILDRARLERNIARMRAHIHGLGASIRPHAKTAKSIDVIRAAVADELGGITVSTLKEADYFLSQGIRDIVYAVGIAPNKIEHVIALIEKGAQLCVLLDNVAVIGPLAAAARRANVRIPVLIELDVDGHRSGVPPEGPLLLEVGQALQEAVSLEARGVLTHAGDSYNCRGIPALQAMAEQERAGAVRAAERLRAAGIDVRVVSIGSTPTATFAQSLVGVTEVRAGVYMFEDLVMAGLGVCSIEDIALSVLVSVIGHQPEKGWIITDGGWTALSRDRGTAAQSVDQGYGLARDSGGRALNEDLIVISTNQEHGIIGRRNGALVDPARYPVGTMLRILPNHACATAAQYDQYYVVAGDDPHILATWPRFRGW
jgi:D-serine deaminase-like pyridoxal phosphate-dependent protein